MVIFGFVLSFILFGGLNFYVVARVGVLLSHYFSSSIELYWLLALCLILLPFVLQLISYLFDIKFTSIIGTLGTWIFIGIVLIAIALGIDHVIGIGFKVFNIDALYVKNILVMIILCIGLGFGFYYAFNTKVTYLSFDSKKIKKPIKILFIADIHVNDIFSKWQIQTINNKIMKLKPDLVLFGGDFFDQASPRLVKHYEALNTHTNQQIPMIAVPGNHDMNHKTLGLLQEKTSINILGIHHIEKAILQTLDLQIIGLPDKYSRKKHEPKQLLDNISFEQEYYTILLTHQPIKLEKIKGFPIDLGLAGHTHRGQFYGARELVSLGNDYNYGLYTEGDKNFFVTQGIGTWGFPFRLGSRSEVVLIQLNPKKEK